MPNFDQSYTEFCTTPDSYEETMEMIKSQSNFGIVIESPTANIPPELDDLPLNVFEYRVLCRIIRWGECSESIQDMAKALQINQAVIRKALQRLNEQGHIRKLIQDGKPDVYFPNLIN